MKHPRGVHANPLTASFASSGRNKSLCFSESNMTQNIKILVLSKPGVPLVTGIAWSIPTTAPPQVLPREEWVFPHADTENLRSQGNDAEGAGEPWAPHAQTPFSSFFFTHAPRCFTRVAEFCFPAATTLDQGHKAVSLGLFLLSGRSHVPTWCSPGACNTRSSQDCWASADEHQVPWQELWSEQSESWTVQSPFL